MTIYVDQLFKTPKTAKWPYMQACHMFCDGPFEELHQMADRLELKRAHFQNAHVRPTLWHYDLTPSKRALAVQYGAAEITGQQWSLILNEAIEKQQRGILRHACGHEEMHTDLLGMNEDEARILRKQWMSELCSACA